MARTELFGLEHEIQVVGGHPLTHQIRAVADHHVDPFRLQLARAVDDVAEHRLAGNGMEDLGQGRTHAGALAGGENHDFKGHGLDYRSWWSQAKPVSEDAKRKRVAHRLPFSLTPLEVPAGNQPPNFLRSCWTVRSWAAASARRAAAAL